MVIVLEVFTIFLIITITLLFIGLFKRQYIFLMLSGLMFLILTFMLNSGIQYVTGQVVTNTGNAVQNASYNITSTYTNTYTSWSDSIIKIPLMAIFMLFGLFIITMSWIKLLGKNIGLELWGNDEEEER